MKGGKKYTLLYYSKKNLNRTEFYEWTFWCKQVKVYLRTTHLK